MSNTTARLERRCRFCGQVAPASVAFCSHCGASLSHQAATDDPILAKLRVLFERELEIERELGRGGTAAVYLAYDATLQRRVAVKSLLPDIAADPSMAARFIREARTVAALQHPHVVSVYGVRTNNDVSAIVMQYVDGRSLDVVLRETTPLSLGTAGRVLSQVAAGLQHAHERGIVHRDVKPANVLLDREGSAFVSDFGLAQPKDSTRITDTGLVVGTLAYMSPEQRTGGEVGAPSDQYAFGVMAFEMLTGRLPFTGSLPEMVNAHLFAPPPSVRTLRGDVPPAVDAVIARMLAKNPAERFAHLREIEREFRALIPHASGTTVVVPSGGLPTGSHQSRVMTSPELAAVATAPRELRADVTPPPTRIERARRPVRTYALALAAIVPLAVSVWAWSVRERGATTETATASPPGPRVASPDEGTRTPVPSDPTRRPAAGAPRGGEGTTPPSLGTQAGADLTPTLSAVTAARGDTAARAAIDSAGRGSSGAVGVAGGAITAGDSATGRTAVAPPGPGTPPANAVIPTRVAPPATLPDARALARQFVTMLNGGRWRELERVASIAGDTTLRSELVRLVRSAAEFRAGFQRVASAPEDIGEQFSTECIVDLEWRGGRLQLVAELRASYDNGAWHLAGLRLARANLP